MKNFCFLLLLLAGTAHADYWSYPTKDKGEIVLTLEQFSKDHIAKNCRGWYAAYVIDKFNRVIYGCWLLSNGKINVHYTDGDFRVYEKSGWTYHKDEKKKAPIRRLTVDHCCGGFPAGAPAATDLIFEPLAS
ncbi:MAG: hypothetical protein K9J47_08870 [Sulfuritalea sp.]|nr:hypothetical protein [Polynucleobacter sp.]MCF8188872.1 hypothetical protein [Sulfuritalea sp.]